MKDSKWLLIAGLAIVLMTIGCQKQMGFVDPNGGANNVNAATTTLLYPYGGNNWFLYFRWTPPTQRDLDMSIGQSNGGIGNGVSVWEQGQGTPPMIP